MMENKTNMGLKWLIFILVVLVIGLVFYIVYDKGLFQDTVVGEDSDIKKTTTSNNVVTNKYGIMSEKEIKEMFNNNLSIQILNKQNNNIEDVDQLLKDNNDYILERILIRLSNEGENLSKQNILSLEKELIGYNIGLEFNDIYDGNTLGYKWDSQSEKYEQVSLAAFAHGACNYYTLYDVMDIDSDEENIYTVLVNQLWTGNLCEGENPEEYYSNLKDATNAKNSVYKVNDEDDFNSLFDMNYLMEKEEVKDNVLTYQYKIVKTDNEIKLLSYEKK